ncbi:MAG: multicopper oxidase domain-containing protein [Microthrixaceae bacterium]|nr:multicopper oxidase domain-containing protein [Microthrixaceae bacterium]
MAKDTPSSGKEQEVVSRRAVVGATVGGVGAATLVGVAAAAAWPESSGGGGGGGNSTGGSSNGTDDTSKFAVWDPNTQPPEDFKAVDPVLPPAPAETVHDITLTATEHKGEVALGVVQELWGFDNKVPGPVLRGKQGDQFNVTLKNEGAIGHSVDFHASLVAPNVRMATIQPGEELPYPFKAKHHGIYMYHCGTAPVLHHIGAGMYGAIVIDPPDLAPVDYEFIFVQSEFYLGEPEGVGDYDKMLNEKWDLVTFNGFANQYVYDPIEVDLNKRVRAWVLNTGPTNISSFHIVGTIFDTVYKEGNHLLRPGDGNNNGGCQVLDLMPAQGGYVEFTFEEAGLYTMVSHRFSDVPRGAAGVFKAGEFDLPTDGDMGH